VYEALLVDFYGTLVEEDTEVIARIVSRIAASSPLGPDRFEVARRWARRFSDLCAASYGVGFRTLPGSADFLAGVPVPVCLVSNIDTADLESAVDSLGWTFPAIVTSETCRSYKPRPEPFEAALGAFHGSPYTSFRRSSICCPGSRETAALPSRGDEAS